MSKMPPVSGFTIVRNGTKFDYPYLESLRSLLPLVDELVVNVGKGDDDTLEQVERFAREGAQGKKVVVFENDWRLDDAERKKGGMILSEQTNIALDRCSNEWCIYLQADEVIHERDYDKIRASIAAASSRPEIEGLLFDYVHFYGSFDVIQQTRSAYRREVRAVRRSSTARSVGDAQSFRRGADNGKLVVMRAGGARIFHYGWVRTPEAMKEKTYFMDQLYHGAPTPEAEASRTPFTGDNYRYKRFWGLKPFVSTHPAVMRLRIDDKGWHWNLKTSPFVWKWSDTKKVVLDLFERATGLRLFEYRSYKLVRR
jgi:hypothetical protein